MPEITFKIGKYDAETRDVPVTFTSGEIVHPRRVNAVLKANGTYDAAATREQVQQVANGVAAKIAAGVITNPPPEPVPAAED